MVKAFNASATRVAGLVRSPTKAPGIPLSSVRMDTSYDAVAEATAPKSMSTPVSVYPAVCPPVVKAWAWSKFSRAPTPPSAWPVLLTRVMEVWAAAGPAARAASRASRAGSASRRGFRVCRRWGVRARRHAVPLKRLLARLGSARLGSARLGSARLGSARLGSAHNSQFKTLVGCQVFFHAVPNLSAVVPSPASTAASAGGGHGAAGALPGALLSRRFRKHRMQRAGHGRSGLSTRDCACRGLDGLGGLQPRGTRARTAGTSPRRNESTRARCVATRRSPVGGSPSCTTQAAHRPPATVAT